MNKYDVEMAYGFGVTVSGVLASSPEEALAKAKQKVEEEISILDGANVDAGGIEYECPNFIREKVVGTLMPLPKQGDEE